MATSTRGGPPFRAEHIGSFLRPPALLAEVARDVWDYTPAAAG